MSSSSVPHLRQPLSPEHVRSKQHRWLPKWEPLAWQLFVPSEQGAGASIPDAPRRFSEGDASELQRGSRDDEGALEGEPPGCNEVTQLTRVDPTKMRCSAVVRTPSGRNRVLKLRFTEADAMERWLSSSPIVHPHRHHRCACCLEWVADGVRCKQCQQPMHRACAEKWLRKSGSCPTCRATWEVRKRPGVVSEGFAKEP